MRVAAKPKHSAPAEGILERMSAHLDRLVGYVVDLEQTVSAHLRIESKPDPATIRELQALDRLRQSLEDMSVLLLLVGQHSACTEEDILTFSEKLKLESTKAVLMGSNGNCYASELTASGELDLF